MFITESLLPSIPIPENHRHLVRYINFINSRPERNLKKEIGFCFHHVLPVSMGGTDDHLIKLTFREHYVAHLILWRCGYQEMITAFFLINTPWYKGKYYSKNYISAEQYDKLQMERSRKMSQEMRGENNPNWNHRWSKEKRDEFSVLSSKRFTGSRWMNNGIESKCVEKHKIDSFLFLGWKFGRLNQKPTTKGRIVVTSIYANRRCSIPIDLLVDYINEGYRPGFSGRFDIKHGYKMSSSLPGQVKMI
jgi:hypothetical protein